MADAPQRSKHLSPQDTIDEFWKKFNTKAPGQAFTILPLDIFAQKAGQNVPKGTITGQNASAYYEEAVAICKRKVEKIAKECRRVNQKYRDPHFDIEFDLKWGRRDCLETLATPNRQKTDFRPLSVKRVSDIFDNPSFYISGPTTNDIRQGRDGDCWFMAALCTLGNKKGLIEKNCVARDEETGVYGFVFYRDFEWRSEIVDDKLYLTKPDYDESHIERVLWEDRERISSEDDYRKAYQSNSGALYFAQCEDPNETWLPLLEKAYAKAHGDYAAIEGGFTGEGIEDLTGGVTTELFSTDIFDKEHFWNNELLKVNDEFLFGCATGLFRGWGERKGIQERHAYSIMRAVEIDGHRLLLLKNPWGKGEWTGPWSDGSSQWTPEWMQKLNHRFGNDGAFWISYEDLLRKFQTFDRTRLFSPDWTVTKQWTSLKVSWTVEYHETKFAFTLEQSTSVVLVLSQLDSRYFRGLEGQYFFELSFRLHRAGDDEYIVRSHGNYCMRRSVSTELDLDAGEYHVLLRIVAERDFTALPVQTVVRDNCREQRDKLLRIGLAYDLAHAKGKTSETIEEAEGKEKAQVRKTAKERREVKSKLLKEKRKEKEIERRQQRKAVATKAKADQKAAAKALEVITTATTPPQAFDTASQISSSAETSNTVAEARKVSETLMVVSSNHQCKDTSSAPIQTLNDEGAEHLDHISDASDVSSGAIDEEIERSRAPATNDSAKKDTSSAVGQAEVEDEFERDPWNAVAVIGLRIFSRHAGVTLRVVRPRSWEDGETCLDVDDSAADATTLADEHKPEDRRGSVMGFRGRLGSIFEV
ncbi:MAG: hypothetical protein M1818_004110 [Claussenomyces sp. TS43310]|nr:MAG: hypothetical protein M1818_004110 [Claussenomyces sp. TS43310]